MPTLLCQLGQNEFGLRVMRELDVLAAIAKQLPAAPEGQVWLGDDAAVLGRNDAGEFLLLASDAVVDGVHVDRAYCSAADIGWKAIAVNVSDIAAMGGRNTAAVVSVVAPSGFDVEAMYVGITEASTHFLCPVVGGDLSSGRDLVVNVSVLGCAAHPVLRTGANVGDLVWVTGSLGASNAGLRELQHDYATLSENAQLHRRPRPSMQAGLAASAGGATAMMDLSDGLSVDAQRLVTASRVAFALNDIPIAAGAVLDDALHGGEDYRLLFSAPDRDDVLRAFTQAGLELPIEVGACVAGPPHVTFRGEPLAARGFIHSW